MEEKKLTVGPDYQTILERWSKSCSTRTEEEVRLDEKVLGWRTVCEEKKGCYNQIHNQFMPPPLYDDDVAMWHSKTSHSMTVKVTKEMAEKYKAPLLVQMFEVNEAARK